MIMKDYSKTDHPLMLSGYQFFIGGIVMIAVGTADGRQYPDTVGEGLRDTGLSGLCVGDGLYDLEPAS